MNSVHFSTGKDDWGTPQDLFDALNEEFNFTLDPCADNNNHKCAKYYTIEQDGLAQSWAGETVFCNPPYSRKTKTNAGQIAWVQKCYKEATEGGDRRGYAYTRPNRYDHVSRLHFRKTFIENIAAAARKHAANYGIAVISPIIAQAINESGWGKSTLAAKYHNYFGMKCGSAWKGKSVNMSTCEEYEVGVLTQIKDNFRVYDSLEEGVKGYFDFISASRYANLKGVTDPKTYIENIKADGYATSSQYIKNLLNLVSAYNLTQYDNITAQQGKKSVAEIAQEVIAGVWGNGTERKEKLEAAGYNYAEVQAIVNERAGNKTENKADNKKSIAEIAQEIVAGKWGNGSERKQRLEAEGYNYAEVQAAVNNIMGKSEPSKKNVAEIAKEVISGKWGNGSERKQRLEAAGYNYAEVQAKVNEMLR